MSETIHLSAAEQARRVKAGELSARALTEAHLARIEARDGAIGAFLKVDREGALAAADAVDQAVAAGRDPGPLAGVPIALKDLLVTRGLATTAGSKILGGWVPPYDGTAVARLRAAGAVLLGKLNLDEFGMGSSNENSAFGPCRNPWDLDRVSGGSSGGSAAAVASFQCAAALGTDTGGSIRQPAAFCGLVGLKPTYGRVSRYGMIAFASSFDQIGPLTRTVEDAALLLELIAGLDPRDASSIDAPVPAYREALAEGLAGRRIGLPDEYFRGGADAEVLAAVERAAEVFRGLGAELVPVSLPHTKYALPVYYLLAPAEASSNLARYDGVRFGQREAAPGASLLDMYRSSRGAGFGTEVKRRIMLGTFALRAGHYDAYYAKAQKVRALITRDFAQAFEQVDLLLSPTTPTAAFRLGEKTQDPVDMYRADIFTLGCNLAGLPGLNMPCGFTGAGLPIGMQLLAPALGERALIAAAAAYEREVGAIDGHGVPLRRPPEQAAEAGS
ncbi:Asp-tRNA(Asn)/Glu-tRNA(Gln) amidotransferase subunit GatA [Haliangium ochraceum]|uniref:Glutamyl-tRNA(Gln) amidotransferase subunit A n=1 Tax=Haliangium ochraceum (strain DSM 14365 / JCM 11303 / SMP-2) TaxID=502025 RepID=D0LUA8_HALO1|nr:Asp-tRNA(Asn)/Glu-tRNA(Gln) amidotransferase subunit GatA [Haliangium ochraceum]ACY19231.1 glutamyl-tRNA(Gln) amidotransferase, A subunit [Haliangium ochraceum DSM 14365]